MLSQDELDGPLLDEALEALDTMLQEHGDNYSGERIPEDVKRAADCIAAGGPTSIHNPALLVKQEIASRGGVAEDSLLRGLELGFWIGVHAGFRDGFVDGWANGRSVARPAWTSSRVEAVKHRCEFHGQVGFVYEYSSGRCWARLEGPDEKLGSFPDLDSARSAIEERAAQRKGG